MRNQTSHLSDHDLLLAADGELQPRRAIVVNAHLAQFRRNLWPERYTSRVWNAHVKDELEDLLPQLVCERKVPLATAQRDIASNWIAAYKKYFQTDRPHPPSSRRRM